jgi:hypothetical protein
VLLAVTFLISAYLFLIAALVYGLVQLDRADVPIKKVLKAHVPVLAILVLIATLLGWRRRPLQASPTPRSIEPSMI